MPALKVECQEGKACLSLDQAAPCFELQRSDDNGHTWELIALTDEPSVCDGWEEKRLWRGRGVTTACNCTEWSEPVTADCQEPAPPIHAECQEEQVCFQIDGQACFELQRSDDGCQTWQLVGIEDGPICDLWEEGRVWRGRKHEAACHCTEWSEPIQIDCRPPGPPVTATCEDVEAIDASCVDEHGNVCVGNVCVTVEETDVVCCYDVQYSDDAGGTWQALGTFADPPSFCDRFAGNATIYRVRSFDCDACWCSKWTEVRPACSTGNVIKHPADCAADAPIPHCHVREFGNQQREARRGIFQPIGRPDAVVVSDTYGPWSGQIVLRTDTAAQRRALDGLLEACAPVYLQLNGGGGDAFCTECERADRVMGSRWVVFGDQQREPLADREGECEAWETLSWTEVGIPPAALDNRFRFDEGERPMPCFPHATKKQTADQVITATAAPGDALAGTEYTIEEPGTYQILCVFAGHATGLPGGIEAVLGQVQVNGANPTPQFVDAVIHGDQPGESFMGAWQLELKSGDVVRLAMARGGSAGAVTALSKQTHMDLFRIG